MTVGRELGCALLTGALATLVLFLPLLGVPGELYQARDDAVVTLSHARNLVDHGFVGVGPSGERVEGFSSPLHFVLCVAATALAGGGYRGFLVGFPFVVNFLFGVVCYAAMRELLPEKRRPLLALLLGTLVSWAVSTSTSAILWLHSGMENPLVHLAYAACVWLGWRALRSGTIPPVHGVLFGIAALARSEGILHVSFLLAALLVAFRWSHGSWRPPLRAAAVGVAVWAGLFAVRALYFSDLKPNTAYAQEIDIGLNLWGLFRGELQYKLDLVGWAFRRNGGLLLLAGIAMLLPAARDRKALGAALFPVAGALSLVVHWTLLGGARLEPNRTTTFLAVHGGLLLGCAVASSLGSRSPRVALGVPALGLLLLSPLGTPLQAKEEPAWICCNTEFFEEVNVTIFRELRDAQRLPRPFVASPDLGALSFHKEFNILDAGYLASEPLAKSRRDPVVTSAIFERLLMPDFILLYQDWLCVYRDVWSREAFRRAYAQVVSPVRYSAHADLTMYDADLAALSASGCAAPPEYIVGVLVRREIALGSGSAERRLVDAMGERPDVELLEREIRACNLRSAEPDSCLHVVRTAYRFLPELTESGQMADLDAALGSIADPRQRELARAILRGRSDGRLRDAFLAYLR